MAYLKKSEIKTSFVDLLCFFFHIGFNADPDPAFYLNANPDPETNQCGFIADPVLDPGQIYGQKVEISHKKFT